MKKLLNCKKEIQKFVSENKVEVIILVLILALGAFMRLYKINQYMTFLGDEGRDAIVVRRLIANFDIILVGPGTSIGNMYLGPLYYYLIAPALFLANFSPVGPAIMIAILGIVTIWFVWFIVREWFSIEAKVSGKTLQIGALVAALLYAISPVIIVYSRSSWNPNIMPFFSLLTIYSMWRVWTKSAYKWLLVAGVSFAFVMQSHYLGLLLLPVIGFIWLIKIIYLKKKERIILLKNSVWGFLSFTFLMSPLVIFDARHGWRNFAAMKEFFTKRQTTVNAKPWKAIPNIMPIAEEFVQRVVTSYEKSPAVFITYFLIIFLAIIVVKPIFKKGFVREFVHGKLNTKYYSYFVLALWTIFTFVGLGLYKQEIYDHYYGIVYALPFILIGAVIQEFESKSRKIGYLVAALFILILVPYAVKNSPLRMPPNSQLERSEVVSKKIIQEAGGQPFNFAVIAERNYEGAYQYYLERVKADFRVIDPQRVDDTITQQLYVICEMPEEKCDPTHNDKAEVANFGWTDIEEKWDVFGVTLYKLVHSKQ